MENVVVALLTVYLLLFAYLLIRKEKLEEKAREVRAAKRAQIRKVCEERKILCLERKGVWRLSTDYQTISIDDLMLQTNNLEDFNTSLPISRVTATTTSELGKICLVGLFLESAVAKVIAISSDEEGYFLNAYEEYRLWRTLSKLKQLASKKRKGLISFSFVAYVDKETLSVDYDVLMKEK